MYTLDTNAIIYYFKNDANACAFFDAEEKTNALFYVSSITELELFSFRNLTETDVQNISYILSTISIIPVESRIARIAAYLRRRYGVKVPDSIIAATAIFTHTKLVTRNVKDFTTIEELQLCPI